MVTLSTVYEGHHIEIEEVDADQAIDQLNRLKQAIDGGEGEEEHD